MRSALYCVIVTLSVAAAACGGNGDPADAGPPADAPIAADGSSITPDGAILNQQGLRFLLPRQ